MSDKQLLPDFLIIGAGKSGTTSLDNYLKQHPRLFFSRVKEPNFFAYDNVSTDKMDKYVLRHYKQSVTNLTDYKELFREAKPDQLKGETSNTYLTVKHAAERIKHYIPDAKLIAILRQPTERLYSRFLHLARDNRLPSDRFEDVLDRNSIWWQRNDLVKEGFYYKNLSRYFELFPRENIRVYLNDDLKKDSLGLMKDIFDFLGVEPLGTINDSVKYNKSGIIKNKFYDKTLGHNSVFKVMLKKMAPTAIYNKAKESIWLQKVVNNLQNRNLEQPKLSPALHDQITNEIYKEDIEQLATLLNRDLSKWLAPKSAGVKA